MKTFLKIILGIFLLFIISTGSFMLYLKKGLEDGENLKINSIDLSSIDDGEYIGRYTGGRWKNTLKITIENKKIRDIEVINDVRFPKPEVSDKLFNRVISKQNTDVDAIAGSTVTSKAYLKSIENSLK